MDGLEKQKIEANHKTIEFNDVPLELWCRGQEVITVIPITPATTALRHP
jgi:hypothetical protein